MIDSVAAYFCCPHSGFFKRGLHLESEVDFIVGEENKNSAYPSIGHLIGKSIWHILEPLDERAALPSDSNTYGNRNCIACTAKRQARNEITFTKIARFTKIEGYTNTKICVFIVDGSVAILLQALPSAPSDIEIEKPWAAFWLHAQSVLMNG